MPVHRRHGGAPDPQRYISSPTVLKSLEPVHAALRDQVAAIREDTTITPASLAQVVHAVMLFQDQTYGKKQGLTRFKLPSSIFRDTRPQGALVRLLRTCFQCKLEKDLRRFTWNNPTRNDLNNEIFDRIVADLKEAGLLTLPACWVSPDIPEPVRTRCIDIINTHGGRVVTEKTQASHIILPEKDGYEDPKAPEGGKPAPQYLRAVQTGERQSLVHWWYFPDSYDEWLPNAEVVGDPEPPQARNGAWEVTAKFVLHTGKFNEWMNETDYEPDEADNTVATGKRGRHRAVESSEEPASKRVRTEAENQVVGAVLGKLGVPSAAATAVPIAGANTTAPIQAAVKEPVGGDMTAASLQPNRGQLSISNASRDNLNPGVDPLANALAKHAEKLKQESDKAASAEEEKKSFDAKEVLVPSYAMWFKFGAVHDIEKKALPEFFDKSHSSKNEATYIEYRDFMINSYRLDPHMYLTVTAARRNLAGDICSLMRVHAFLEHWGLINYRVEPDTIPVRIPPVTTANVPIMAAIPKDAGSNSKLVGQSRVLNMDVLEKSGPVMRPALHLQPNKYSDMPPDAQLSSIRKTCCVTCNVELVPPAVYYYCPSRAFYLCPSCFGLSQFPPDLTSQDFQKIETDAVNGDKQTSASWTENETLLLLEGIEKYPNHWDLIAQNVRTKTPQECVLQFMRLPIEDSYLTDQIEKLPTPIDPLEAVNLGQPLPFDQASNPLMSQIAFLSSVVNPAVAAAAAKAALAKVFELNGEPAQVEKATANGDVKMDVEGGTAAGSGGKSEGISQEKLDRVYSKDELQAASATAIAAAAVKASALAGEEEREIRRLVSLVIETQLHKIDLKMKHFVQIEQLYNAERQSLEQAKHALWRERAAFQKERIANEKAKHESRVQQQKYAASPNKTADGAGSSPAGAQQNGTAATPAGSATHPGATGTATSVASKFTTPHLPPLPTALSFTRQTDDGTRVRAPPTMQNLDQKKTTPDVPKAAPLAPGAKPESTPSTTTTMTSAPAAPASITAPSLAPPQPGAPTVPAPVTTVPVTSTPVTTAPAPTTASVPVPAPTPATTDIPGSQQHGSAPAVIPTPSEPTAPQQTVESSQGSNTQGSSQEVAMSVEPVAPATVTTTTTAAPSGDAMEVDSAPVAPSVPVPIPQPTPAVTAPAATAPVQPTQAPPPPSQQQPPPAL